MTSSTYLPTTFADAIACVQQFALCREIIRFNNFLLSELEPIVAYQIIRLNNLSALST
ncbi:hypothetical protein [Nostoc sp. DSM 114167]|uniref:hypothetical protein n=1 Tax=Nostoc sp. DSM 114167 TaxID=3439050 RepID=UPI0040464A9C